MSKDTEQIREKLLRELGEDAEYSHEEGGHLFSEISYLKDLEDKKILDYGVDIAALFAVQGFWKEAIGILRRYRSLDPSNNSALIFQMRCLFEMENFTELLALGQLPVTEKHHLLAVNYLMGMSFEALEMYPQARSRYEAVIRQDPTYLDVSLRLTKLQGMAGR
jgi:tetratricopeptide (TPR) repeat protein